MYVTRVRLRNIRNFETLDLSFCSDNGRPFRWNVVVGDNATGKTTLLRALAIGLCDQSSAASLVRELKGGLCRSRAKYGEIDIEVRDRRDRSWTIKTRLNVIRKTGEQVSQTVFPATIEENDRGKSKGIDNFPFERLFVAGYGPGRTVEGREEYTEYRNVDAVYTLFRYDQPLQSPELVWRRLKSAAARKSEKPKEKEAARREVDHQIKALLEDVLVLEDGESVELLPKGIYLQRTGGAQPLSSHADGYRSTTAWALDLLAWRLLYGEGVNARLSNIEGIVLIDELEQHLHPRWQRFLVARLAKQFPRIQFIAPTHSALCASGVSDLRAHVGQLLGLYVEGRTVVGRRLELEPGFRADQILTSKAFRLPDTRTPRVADRVARYKKLFRMARRRPQDEQQFKALKQYIDNNVPEAGQLEEEREMLRELRALLKEARKQTGK